MLTHGEFVAAGLVGFMFYNLANMQVKNSGTIPVEPVGEPQPVVEAAAQDDQLYADATGIQDRSVEDVCNASPPEMLSTSLLPASNQHMSDNDFVLITPDKLQNINFLNAGWALGRDTTTNTMRNVSYDLRSEPPNPKVLNVDNNSFANSTIDVMPKRSFEPEAAGGDLHAKLAVE